ncbi:MAG: hypothetical protein E7178_02025 [Erysipelotrichaceae bacterium]|nr:hypothetical protein [Erysipelotrichaceae bacterium]
MRYFKLYFTCIKRSMMSRLEYKRDSIISILAFLISNACSLCSIYFILQAIPSLKGYTPAEIGFFYGFSMLPIAIDHLFSDEFWLVAFRRVQLGDMDRHFLRPVPVIFQMFAETFQPDGFGEVIVGITMIVICGLNLQVAVSFGAILVLSIGAIFGAIIITSFKIAISSLAFIFKRSGPLLQIIYNFTIYAKYPIAIYPYAIRFILIFIFPFGLFISLPVDTLLYGSYNPYLLSLAIIGAAIAFFTLATFIWTLCARRYESTGS